MDKFDDPNHPFNGPDYHTGKVCVECGKRPAGTAWSPHWCQVCNAERIKRINKNMKEIMAGFNEKGRAE